MDLEVYKSTNDSVNKSRRASFAEEQLPLCQYRASIGFCLNRESSSVSSAGIIDYDVSADNQYTRMQMTSSDLLHADNTILICLFCPDCRHTSNGQPPEILIYNGRLHDLCTGGTFYQFEAGDSVLFAAMDLSRAHSVRSQSFPSSVEFDDLSMTSSHDYDAVRKDTSDFDVAFFDDVGVQTVELTRLHTPPERDVTTSSSKQLAVTNSSDTDSLQDFNPTNGGEVMAELVTEMNVSTSSPPVNSDVNERSTSKTEPTSAPSSLIFTIDFGPNDGKYQITDHWTHPTPFRRTHRRTVSSKTQKSTTERTTNSTDATKLPKTARQGDVVRSSFSPEGHAAGYHSDGHDSAESSDESASVRSEMAGSASNRRNADILRKNLLSSGCPSQSQPSLVQAKKTVQVKPNQKQLTSSSVVAAKTAPGKQQRPAAATATNKSHSLSSRPPAGLRASESRSAACKSSSTTASGGKDVSKVPPLPSSSANRKHADKSRKSGDRVKDVNACKFLDGSSEDISSVTAYLIDRMLGRADASLEAGDDAHCLSGPQDKKQNGGDNHSDAGTYTIDEEDESADTSGRQRKCEVQQARDRIGQVFGINENGDIAAGSGNLVRPVIDGDDCEVYKKVRDVVADNAKMATEDEVFGDDELHDHYKREIGEAVSNALSATNQAIQHVLGLESRRKGKSQTVVDTCLSAASGPPGVNSSLSQVGHSMSEQPAVGGKVIVKSPSNGSATSDDRGHHRQQATVVCESEGNFGSFTVSYDAPSARPRQNMTLESTPSRTSADESTKRATSKDNFDVDKTVHRSSAAVAVKTDIENVSSSERDLAEKAACRRRVQPAIPRPVRKEKKSLTGLQVARSVGDVSRVFANEPLQRVSRAAPPGKGKRTPPPGVQSTPWSCWRKDVAETSDAGGSDAESTCSAGGADHSGGEQRRVALRSAPVVLSTRTNRTFALRCAAKQRAEAQNSQGTAAAAYGGVSNKQNRSRSAENNARLALMSRSRSGSRPRSPKDHVHQNASAAADCRRRQPSNDSSATSVSLSISMASHDTTAAAAAAASRPDVSRPHGMRVEKSGLFGSLTSLAKQSSPKDRNAAAVASCSHHGKSGSSAAAESAESKELTAWKRRKDYDARKSVAEERAKNTTGRSVDQSPGQKANSVDQQKDLVDVDEIAMLSNAVAYNLNVLSQCTQSEAVTLDLSRHHLLNVDITKSAFTAVKSRSSKKSPARQSYSDYSDDLGKNSCDAVLVNSIQQMSCKVKTLTDKLMSKIKHEVTKLPDDQSDRSGMPESWQNSSPELAAILENLKRTEQHLQTVHSTLSSTDRSAGSRGHTSGRGRHQNQIQAVAKQRLHQAEQAGFKPIDNPIQSTTAKKNTKSGTASFRAPIRRQSTGGAAVRRRSSDSSENPLSGEEFY